MGDVQGTSGTFAGRHAVPYLCSCVPFLALLVTACLTLPWGGDYGVHGATIERLRTDLTDPGNPMVDENTPSPYYSPWMVLVATVAKVTGWPTSTMLSLCGVVAVVVLLTGVWRFARALAPTPRSPVLMLVCMTLLWGVQLFAWSGFLPLSSLVRSVGYPSTLAWGLTLHLWAVLPQTAQRGWPRISTLLSGVFAALILLVHQFTGIVMAVGAVAFMVSHRRSLSGGGWLRLLGAVALVVAILLAWPYYRFFSLGNTPGESDAHQALYQDILLRYGLLLLGVPALMLRWRRDRFDPLFLLLVGCASIYLVGGLTGHYEYGRVIPGAMFAAQAALAVEASTRRSALVPITGLTLLFGLWVQGSALSYALYGDSRLASQLALQSTDVVRGYSWIVPYVQSREVVMTNDGLAERRVPFYGGYVVYCPYPDPFLGDWNVREADTRIFFDAATTQPDRTALLAKYHVRWIIQARNPTGPDLGLWYQKIVTGPNGETLYRVGWPEGSHPPAPTDPGVT
jgi:hypothetical protein